MANEPVDMRISQLDAAVSVADTDEFPATKGALTKKYAASLVKDYMIGDNNISALGDGSVTGAILNVKSASETADSNIAETMAQNGAHNLLPFPYAEGSQTRDNTTYVVNSNGTITISGIPNETPGYSYLMLEDADNAVALATKFAGKSVKFSAIEATAEATGVHMQVEGFDSGNVRVLYVGDIQEERTVAIPSSVVKLTVNIGVARTFSGNAVTFKPMLTRASDPSNEYAAPAMTNRELTEKKVVDITPETGFTVESNNSFECAGVLYLNFMLSASTAVQTTVLQTVASINKTPSVASQLSGAGLDDNGYLQGAIGGRLFTNGYIVAAAPTGTTKLYIEGVILL